MKTWKVYLSDYPTDPIVIQASNYTKMKQEAYNYIQRWQIDAEIDRIEEVE